MEKRESLKNVTFIEWKLTQTQIECQNVEAQRKIPFFKNLNQRRGTIKMRYLLLDLSLFCLSIRLRISYQINNLWLIINNEHGKAYTSIKERIQSGGRQFSIRFTRITVLMWNFIFKSNIDSFFSRPLFNFFFFFIRW